MKKFILSFIFLPTFFTVQCFSQNNPPTAVNDTVTIGNCDTITIPALANDYDIDGNPIRIQFIMQGMTHKKWSIRTDSTISVLALPDYVGADSLKYRIREISNDGSTGLLYDTAWIHFNIQNDHCVDSININNINARINNNGNLFWDLIDESKFEVPKSSGKHTIFISTFWIGGVDSLNTLHVAAECYEQIGFDFWPGPISNVYDSSYNAKWNHVWEIYKTDIDYHLANCWQSGYIPAQVLIDWPGNGNTALGQSAITAPFKDWNSDGIYNPYGGDYPLIKGDQAIYYIFNDDRSPHTESGGNKLGIEVHGMAYAFNCPQDSALWNTIFLNYKIYNLSALTYDSTFIGNFTDTDLGDWSDDYVGCDVQRGAGYVYNGDDVDGQGQSYAYGSHPPAQAVVFLAGAKIDNDGIDNPDGLCDNGINGFNFGNGTIDDERFGLRRFAYHSNDAGVTGSPQIAIDYYNYLQGRWRDSTRMQWGGIGYVGYPGTCGPECDFMFPGATDPCNWGTAGLTPNCTPNWTEETAGHSSGDRRFNFSSGPFTFKPGDVQELDLAFIFGRDYVDSTAWAGVTVMQQRIDSIRKYFANDSTPCGLGFSGIVSTPKIIPQIDIYPNPANGFILVETSGMTSDIKFEIFDIVGRKTKQGKCINTVKNSIDVSSLGKGLYILNVSDGVNKFSRKFVKQ